MGEGILAVIRGGGSKEKSGDPSSTGAVAAPADDYIPGIEPPSASDLKLRGMKLTEEVLRARGVQCTPSNETVAMKAMPTTVDISPAQDFGSWADKSVDISVAFGEAGKVVHVRAEETAYLMDLGERVAVNTVPFVLEYDCLEPSGNAGASDRYVNRFGDSSEMILLDPQDRVISKEMHGDWTVDNIKM